MSHVISRDGTRIAYERSGSGPAVILIDGALCTRAFGPMPKSIFAWDEITGAARIWKFACCRPPREARA